MWLLGKFMLKDTAGSPERVLDSSILPAWVANPSAGFDLSYLLTELALY